LWFRYNPRLIINDQWTVKADIDERVFAFPFRQHQFVARTQAEYTINPNWKVSAGGSFFQNALPQNPFTDVEISVPELRPEFETNIKHNLGENWKIQHRFRADFRFPEIDNTFTYSHSRFRYMLQFKRQLSEHWTMTVWDEILVNGLKEIPVNTFDQNRIGANFTYNTAGPFAVDIMYFNWYQLRLLPNNYFNRHIVRLTLIHKIRVKQ
jgi:hypothetical protein